MRAHLVQPNIAWEDREANLQRADELVRAARPSEGDVVLFPEMLDSGFSFAIERTADVDGRTLEFMGNLARSLRVLVIGGRSVRSPAGAGLNAACLCTPQGSCVEYHKVHPFSHGRPGSRESDHFEAGHTVRTLEFGGLVLCPAVCYDLRFPELFRQGLALGASCYAVIANWPEARHAHWRALLIARAIENQAFVLGVNRAGSDPTLRYLGGSMVVGPRGDVLGELGEAEGVLSVELDVDDVARWREKFNAWRDRRLGLAAPAMPARAQRS